MVKAKIPFWERLSWYCSVIGSVVVFLTAAPALPWRYAKVDTNCGNRFVMERYYYLTGATNNLGKTEMWMSLRRKIQRKVEEFGRPSPLVALVGTATQSLGAGGAAMGCPMWLACKEHVNFRYTTYTTIAYSSFGLMGLAVVQAICSAGCIFYLGFEQDARTKKKKKKKKDEDRCMQIETWTAFLAIMAFCCATGTVGGFTCMTLKMLQDFKTSAYYPFAGAHAAVFVGSFGCILLFISMCTHINRNWKLCGHPKEAPEGGAGYGEGEGYGAYGYGPGAPPGPPGAYGAYPPPAYGQQAQW